MRYFIILITLIGLLTADQQIDTAQSEITFVFLDKDVDGSIGDLKSQSTINTQDFTKSVLKGSVSVTSLKTGSFLRDGHLMWEKYFNRSDYPRIYFTSSKITGLGNKKYEILGTIKMKGTEKEISIKATLADDITATAKINTADYGIEISSDYEKNWVDVKFDLAIKN